MADVSIIVPVFNNRQYVQSCLKALETTTRDLPMKVQLVVVDDASYPDTAALLTEYKQGSRFSDFVLLTHEKNLGFAAACNHGASKATAETLVLLNSDTEPQPGWLESLVAPISSGQASIAGSLLLYPDGSIQHAGVEFTSGLEPVHRYAHLRPEQVEDLARPLYLQAVTGACMAVSAKTWTTVGGLCEGYVNGLEDIDLCLEVRKTGGEILFVPESILIHHESVSASRFDHARENIDLFQSRQRENCFSDSDVGLRRKILKWHQDNELDISHLYSHLVTPELLTYSELVGRAGGRVGSEPKEYRESFLLPDFIEGNKPVIGISAYMPPIMIADLIGDLAIVNDVTVAICCANEDQPDVEIMLQNILGSSRIEFVPPDLTLAGLPVKRETIVEAMTDFAAAIACMTMEDFATVVHYRRIPFAVQTGLDHQWGKPSSLNAMRAIIEG